jgi:dephospho-CoA kinase
MKIALTGKMRSGKDTVARYLYDYYHFPCYAFGDKLKKSANELFYFELLDGEKPRELYQFFGQAMRKRAPDIWVHHLFEDVNFAIEYCGATKILITDLRQPNEYERCKAEGFKIVRVNCDDDIRLKRMIERNDSFSKEDLEHETESYIDTFEVDYELYNYGELNELYKQIDLMMDKRI